MVLYVAFRRLYSYIAPTQRSFRNITSGGCYFINDSAPLGVCTFDWLHYGARGLGIVSFYRKYALTTPTKNYAFTFIRCLRQEIGA